MVSFIICSQITVFLCIIIWMCFRNTHNPCPLDRSWDKTKGICRGNVKISLVLNMIWIVRGKNKIRGEKEIVFTTKLLHLYSLKHHIFTFRMLPRFLRNQLFESMSLSKLWCWLSKFLWLLWKYMQQHFWMFRR